MRLSLQSLARTLLNYEWLILLIILTPLMFPNGPQGYLLFVIPLLWLARWTAERRLIPPTPLNSTIILLVIMVGVSLLAIFDYTLSFPKIAGVVLGVAIFYGAISLMRRHPYGSWYILAFFLLSGSGMAAIGLIGTHWVGPFAALNRIKTAVPTALQVIPGTIDGTVNPNELAGILGWIIPLVVVLLIGLWSSWSPHLRYFALLLAIGFSFLLVATFSRGGIVACAIGLLTAFAIGHKWGKWALAITLFASVFIFFSYDLDAVLFSDGVDSPFALNGRLEIWSRALYGIADFPFTGMSMNGFRRVVHIFYPLFLIPPDSDIGHAHNHLLQAALDLGLPGLIAYLGLWFLTFVLLWQSWRKGSHPTTRYFALGLIGSMVAGWFFGILDAIALGARPGFMWWLLLAMAVSVHDAARHQRRFLAQLSIAE